MKPHLMKPLITIVMYHKIHKIAPPIIFLYKYHKTLKLKLYIMIIYVNIIYNETYRFYAYVFVYTYNRFL